MSAGAHVLMCVPTTICRWADPKAAKNVGKNRVLYNQMKKSEDWT